MSAKGFVLMSDFLLCSFGDISSATILGDVSLLTAGIAVVFIYVQLMLGKFNLVEQRVRKLLFISSMTQLLIKQFYTRPFCR